MKKHVLSAVVASLAASGAMAQTIGASAGAGDVAHFDNYLVGAISNPAYANSYNGTDDFGTALGARVFAVDAFDIADDVQNLSDDLTDLESRINAGLATQDDVDDITDLMAYVSEKPLAVSVTSSLSMGIPNSIASAVLYGKTEVRAAVTAHYDENDKAILEDALLSNSIDTSTLGSTVTAQGVGVTEVGLALSRNFYIGGTSPAAIGITPKHVRIDFIDYEQTAADADADDITEDSISSESGISLDIGIHQAFGESWYASAVARNVIPVSAEDDLGNKFEVEPAVTIGGGWHNSWASVATEIDLTQTGGFKSLQDRQYARIGAEVTPLSWLAFRVGYRTDLAGDEPNVAYAGIGLSIVDSLDINLSAQHGGDNAMGAALQVGLRF